jgi:hypothetical protein
LPLKSRTPPAALNQNSPLKDRSRGDSAPVADTAGY